ncbi:gustatory receptor for sugar taste 64a-like [Cydia pomonella]|uniref:gustatory receptor for sugar taste 64a-like n=1 Tax=Cydia pomonella TaxID=82600 RepID=UPI002ADE4E9E|nr:gustatory receptor for sugar taste 64a-like [Cydia pomonella]
MGPWSADMKTFMGALSARLIDATGDHRAGAYLSQRISLAIQRGYSVLDLYKELEFGDVDGKYLSKICSILFQLINITATLTWNYSDLFIVCISYYLNSILQGIYKKVIDNKAKVCMRIAYDYEPIDIAVPYRKYSRKQIYPLSSIISYSIIFSQLQYLSSSFWASVREDYNHAAQLVRAVDEVVSGAVFASFTINLFFICFQLYNLLSLLVLVFSGSYLINDVSFTNFRPLGGYENVIYLTYSMMFVLFRYLCVSLIAARVHTTSQSLAPALYDVSSTVYNVEVQRFLDQVHHDTVALSGLKFFYVTKSLVLTVAGSIFTYELVLLQYGG